MSRAARLAKAARRRKPVPTWHRWGFKLPVTSAAFEAMRDGFKHGFRDAPRSACHHCLSKSGRLADVHTAYHRRRKARTRRNRR